MKRVITYGLIFFLLLSLNATELKANTLYGDETQVITESVLSRDAILLDEIKQPDDLNNVSYVNDHYNYAKLLQYSLYFYDANMCGKEVSSKGLLSWRGNCHTYDGTTYTRKDGSQVYVDLTGGFHDAGDHVKFGLPQAYSAFILGMSYDTDKMAYENTSQTGHLRTITTQFADYLVKCTVLSRDGNNVEAFCCQVGQGGGGYDHGYWGAPEKQPNTNRPIYFTDDNAPSTDIVSLSAAALAMQYKNFGGDKYLQTSKKLFSYAKNHKKAVNITANGFYTSSGWEDDYALAAILLYRITGEQQYLSEFNATISGSNGANSGNAQKPYWPLGWDNVGPAVAYYNGNAQALNMVMTQIPNKNSSGDNYFCVDDWGSARYDTSMQYVGLLYDKMKNTNQYTSWAENQMKYLLGNNSSNRCYVVGYSNQSVRYPHHRASSGYDGGPREESGVRSNVLLGALVGGPTSSGYYVDSATNYQCNEVAIDYNATLVASAAALYNMYRTDSLTQYIDSQYYSEMFIRLNGYCVQETTTGINVGVAYTSNLENVKFRWLSYNLNTKKWETVSDWKTGNWITWKPEKGEYWLRVEAKSENATANYTQTISIKNDYKYGYVSFNGYCIQKKDNGINVGISYNSNCNNLQFRWLSYNLSTKKWETISGWKSGNWITWKPDKGQYWLRVEVKTPQGKVYNYTQVYTSDKDYNTSKISLNDYCVIYRETGIDVGVVYKSNSAVRFRWLVYNTDTKKWELIRDWTTGNWITWKPNKGSYWLRVEAVNADGSTNNFTKVFNVQKDYNVK